MTTTTKADRRKLKDLRARRRELSSRKWYHPAIWYGCDASWAAHLRTEELAKIDAEIDALTMPVVEGVVVNRPTLW